jgi:hypothetical protein
VFIYLETAHTILENAVSHLENGKRTIKAVVRDVQVVSKAMVVYKNNLEKGLKVLAPTISIPAALKRIENETNLKRSIKTGKATGEISSTYAAKHLCQFANSEDKENVRPPVALVSPEPVVRRSRHLADDTDYCPTNGKVFSPREVVQILEPMGRIQLFALMKEWICKELVPIDSLEGLRKVL